jgi:hypothetical protein
VSSTLGAIHYGLEARLPRIVLDEYTRVTLPWAFNEPIIKLGPIPFTFTLGRCLGSICLGYALSAATRSRRLLAAHSALSFACCCLVRVLVRPVP